MGFIFCWLVLGGLWVSHAILCRSWLTGQSIFTGIWFVSLSTLWLFPETNTYVSFNAAYLIVSVHFCFFMGSILTYGIIGKRIQNSSNVILQEDVVAIIKCLFWILGPIAIIGSLLTIQTAGSLEYFQMNALAILRSMLLQQEVQIPVYQRIMSNLLYPVSVIGPICFIASKQSIMSWIYILLPLLASAFYSFAFGGRGSILITVPVIVFVLAVGMKGIQVVKKKKAADYLFFAVCIVSIFLFMHTITKTRMDSSEVAGSFLAYFVGPIPSLSEWLHLYSLQLLNVDFSNFAIIRELMGALGYPHERQIDNDVVFIPLRFNVFTHIAEHVKYFGLLGTIVISGVLGAVSSKLEQKPLTVVVLALRAVFYVYLYFTLFADLACHIVGWWLALFIIIAVIPFFKGVVTLKRQLFTKNCLGANLKSLNG